MKVAPSASPALMAARQPALGLPTTHRACPAGALYWQGWVEGTTAVWWTLNPAGRWGILTTDPAYATIADFAQAADALRGQPFACPANRPLLRPVFPPTPNCPEGCAYPRGEGWEGEVGAVLLLASAAGSQARGPVSSTSLGCHPASAAALRAPTATLISTSVCAAPTTAMVRWLGGRVERWVGCSAGGGLVGFSKPSGARP